MVSIDLSVPHLMSGDLDATYSCYEVSDQVAQLSPSFKVLYQRDDLCVFGFAREVIILDPEAVFTPEIIAEHAKAVIIKKGGQFHP